MTARRDAEHATLAQAAAVRLLGWAAGWFGGGEMHGDEEEE